MLVKRLYKKERKNTFNVVPLLGKIRSKLYRKTVINANRYLR